MGPPPDWQGLCTHWTQCGVSWCWGIHCWFTFVLWCGYIVLCLYYLWHYSRTSTNRHLSTVHTFTRFNLSTMATFLCPQGGHCRVRFNCISNYWWLQMSTTPKNYHSVFKWTLMGYLSVWLLCKCSFGSSQNRMSVWTFITIQCHTGC